MRMAGKRKNGGLLLFSLIAVLVINPTTPSPGHAQEKGAPKPPKYVLAKAQLHSSPDAQQSIRILFLV